MDCGLHIMIVMGIAHWIRVDCLHVMDYRRSPLRYRFTQKRPAAKAGGAQKHAFCPMGLEKIKNELPNSGGKHIFIKILPPLGSG